MRLRLEGAHPAPPVLGEQPLPGRAHYLVGNDPAHWRTDIPTFAQVRYADVYPGIDLVYFGNPQRLEYDLVVAPGADPEQIVLAFEGAEEVTLDASGSLLLTLPGGAIVQRPPRIYQEAAGGRQEVGGTYSLLSGERVAFRLEPYDTARPLVIDPVLEYSTYLGGSGDEVLNPGFIGIAGIAVDGQGQAYVVAGLRPRTSRW